MNEYVASQERVSRARVLVMGDVMIDRYLYGRVDRISPEAPVPVVHITREENLMGGAANVARNIASQGAAVTLVGVIGDDADGTSLEEMARLSGVFPALARSFNHPTTVKTRVMGRGQQLIRFDIEAQPCRHAVSSLTMTFSQVLAKHDVVVFSDYGKGSLEHIEQHLQRAIHAGKPVLVDPKGRDYQRYRGATVLKPNRVELQMVVGAWRTDKQLATKAQRLREQLSVQALVLTKSEEGMTVFDDQGQLDVPATALEVFDVTGAGDTVIATFATLTAAGLSVRAAASLANRAGGIVVGRMGASTVSMEELFGTAIMAHPLPNAVQA